MSNIFHSACSLIHSATTCYICYNVTGKMVETESMYFQGKPSIWRTAIFPVMLGICRILGHTLGRKF